MAEGRRRGRLNLGADEALIIDLDEFFTLHLLVPLLGILDQVQVPARLFACSYSCIHRACMPAAVREMQSFVF